MSFNIAGAAAAYQGYTDENRRLADDARRVKADARADQDAQYTDELRTRQRADWHEQDRKLSADKADVEAVNAQFTEREANQGAAAGQAEQAQAEQLVQQDALQAEIDKANAVPTGLLGDPAAPAGVAPFKLAPAAGVAARDSVQLAPAVAAKVQELRGPAGLPAPRSFNDALERQAELLRRKSARNDISAKDYAEQMTFVNAMRKEGVHDALEAFATGDYQGGLDSFNRVGQHQASRLVKGAEGTTKINGQDVPTHFITLQNPDGTQTTVDVAKAQFQLLDLNARLGHMDRARSASMQEKHNADSLSLQRDQLAQQAKDAAAGRAIQSEHLNLARQQFDASTPFGQIATKEKALGQTLSADQKANLLGVDSLPAATRAQLTSLLKEQDQIAQSLSKAQAEGTWQPESPGAREMATRSVELNLKVAALLGGGKQAVMADPSGLNRAPTAAVKTVPNPVLPTAAPARPLPLAAPGGVGAPAASPVAQAIGVTGDAVMNGMQAEKARSIEAAAKAVKDAAAVYATVANSGDANAIASYKRRMDQASEQYNSLVRSTGNREDAVRAAVGL